MKQNIERTLFIQNVLPGPLVICDPPSIKNGLYLDPLQPGETVELSFYDPQMLSRSIALNNALRNGYAISLSENEFYEQRQMAEQRQIAEMRELQNKIAKTETDGNIFEAEQINLATAGNPHGDGAAEALLAQKNTMNDQRVWAAEYRKAREQGIVSNPVEFKELVESGRLSTSLGQRGRRVSMAEMQNIGAQDQLNMTATKATIAMPGSYNVKNADGETDELGGVYTQRRQLTNFNATGTMVGATTIGVEDSATPTYSGHPVMQRNSQMEDSFVENVDINQDDNIYEQEYMAQNNQVAERLAVRPQSPYIGQRTTARQTR